MKKKKTNLPKINSIHFGLQWICIGLLIGIAIPLLIFLVFRVVYWPLCVLGGIILFLFAIVFAVEMHQDFGKIPYYQKRLAEKMPFDRDRQYAVLKCSICTGEQIAGFKDKTNGHFTEVMVIQSAKDLEYFKKLYQIAELPKEY